MAKDQNPINFNPEDIPITPEWVTGFVDGGGSFSVDFSKNNKCKFCIEIKPSFSVSQGTASKEAIKELAAFFEHGNEHIRKDGSMLKYETRLLNHLIKVICPHFDKYPLRPEKMEDFRILKRILAMMSEGKHNSEAGLREIIILAYQMNLYSNSKSSRRQPIEYWFTILDDAPP